MKRIRIAFAAALMLLAMPAIAGSYISNRAPLAESHYMELPLGAVRAEGWLDLQLQAMRDGLTGHLDEFYPQVVGPRNAWLGGDGDTWERGPYWIDGLLPLAYLLDDEELKAKAGVWVEAMLASQQESGYFGPETDREPEPGLQRGKSKDWWPKMVALKILKQYYMATGDERVIGFMDRYFRYQLAKLPECPLDYYTWWGAQRAGDNLDIVYWLYNLTGESYLLELGELLHAQSTPWTEYFEEGYMLYSQDSLHCVNLGQGFKEPAIYYQQSRDERYLDALKKGTEVIRRTIGLPTGLWGGDEYTHFGDPVRGSELCTAVEMMFSLECALRISGDMDWADYIERIAYNALPTQATDDYSARQYYQQTNQIMCTRATRIFSTPHGDTDQVFGILNGYPCCTTNMHQGWPKFTCNLWYATDDGGLAALLYAPCNVSATVAGDVQVRIQEDTFYPFDESLRFCVSFPGRKKHATFPLKLRIPQWCQGARISVNGEDCGVTLEAGAVLSLNRRWKDGDVAVLELPMQIGSSRWYDDAAVIERGPLLYALKMNEKWEKKAFEPEEVVEYGPWYYQVTSDSPWNYSLAKDDLLEANIQKRFVLVKRDTDRSLYPWNLENAPLSIMAPARPLRDWTEYKGSTGPVQYNLKADENTGEETTIELVPYGCTTLRIAEFPVRRGSVKQ